MLYMASSEPVAELETEDLTIERLRSSSEAVARHFGFPHVYFIGAHTGCSCGFPSVAAEVPVTYFEGMFDDEDDEERLKNLASVRALLELIRVCLTNASAVELFPVWVGDEAEGSHGTIELQFEQLDAQSFFFNERYLYRINALSGT